MKRIYKVLPIVLMGCLTAASCSSDWDDHYDESGISIGEGSDVVIYNGSVADYIGNAADLTKMDELFKRNSIYTSTRADGQYTFIVCADNRYDESKITDEKAFAEQCVADMGVNPAKLTDGSNINTRSGKSVWVYNGGKQLDDFAITKVVKAANGYIYYVDGTIPVRQSAYELLKSLGDEYSRFKELVTAYDYPYFDRENSQPIGVTDDGRTIYDSVIVTKNTLMDRYDEYGMATWNMRSESYTTTMFIPNNTLIDNAIKAAMDSIPLWLNREATDADREKFEEWIVKACFADRRLEPTEVSAGAADFKCVGGYKEIVDEASDLTTYDDVEAAWWRPSVQTVDAANPVNLSNGIAYYCTNFKIPNHIVIYRVKSRFYEIWDNMQDATLRAKYFRWKNWVDPTVVYDAQGQFDLVASGTTVTTNTQWPTIRYDVLTAIPSQSAMENGSTCSVDYDGLVYNDTDKKVYECHLPAGEYYLRMGFKHSLLYSLSIAFNDLWLVKDMNMHATGSDFHFDRGAASPVPHYGEETGIAYPEGFDVDYWQQFNEKAIAYDTDGYTVGVVTLEKSGNFHITVESTDMARIYKAALDSGAVLNRDKNNVNQLMMYHWCLRPTHNNY